jgi:hypothetical protein
MTCRRHFILDCRLMRASRVIAAGTFCIGVLVSSANANAQTAPYTVVTNDGSSYQGDLVENVVGQHVTIRLATGEIRTFRAADIRAQGSAGATVAPPYGAAVTPQQADALTTIAQLRAQALAQSLAVTPGTPGAPPVAYTGPDAVQIHITKANDMEGKLYGETVSGWQPICIMPCSTTVDPKVDYKLHNSNAFRFPAGATLNLLADTGGHRVFRAIGGTMIGVASVGIVVGALFASNVINGGPTPQTPQEQNAQQQTHSHNLVAGGTTIGLSAAMLTAGIIFCNIHPSATLTTSTGVRLVKNSGPTLTPRGFVF